MRFPLPLPSYSTPMELSWLAYAAIAAIGVLTGAINTLAGSGSFITLPILIFFGLDPTLANGTNRVGVLSQSAWGAYSLQQHAKLDLNHAAWLLIPAVAGAIIGALLAVDINEQTMNTFIGVLMVVMLGVVLLNPKQWLREKTEAINQHKSPLLLFIFFLIGIYGGFIQAGVGVFMLIALVSLGKYTLNHSNTIKLIVTLALTVPAIGIFIYNGEVHWQVGIVLAISQSLGAVGAARFAAYFPGANHWVRRLLIAIMVGVIIKFLNLHHFLAYVW